MQTLVFFSDGSKIELHENELLFGIRPRKNDKVPVDMTEQEATAYLYNFPKTTGYNGPFELWRHAEEGLIPAFTEILANYFFFFTHDDPKTIYSSNNVVRIETK
ncbi:hypothetical protein [Lapidilactobacillus wuchangensis]|uniref:hypothetical protein n=1 Tax=Lapidilactobacillus wuchangensis TaxID=2486001 RepID=UPI000F77645E|nr:hypothetical protein [Lapidilactobacillus wuchangensis]